MSNTKFKDFDKLTANLGNTVSFDKPPRYVTHDSLIVTFQNSEQREPKLTVDPSDNTAYAFSAEQFVFNVRNYMEKFGKAAIAELSAIAALPIQSFTYSYGW